MSSVFGLSSALSTLSTVIGGLMSGKDAKEITNDVNKKYDLITSNGSITKLLSRYIVEPVIFATYDAKESDVFDNVTALNVDIFTSFYMQAFQVLTNQMGVDSNTAIQLLSTDSSAFSPQDVLNIGSKMIGRKKFGVSTPLANLFATEDYNYLEAINNPKNRFLKLSMEWGETEVTQEPDYNDPELTDDDRRMLEYKFRKQTELDVDKANLRDQIWTRDRAPSSSRIEMDRDMNELDKHPLYAIQTRSLNIKINVNTGDAKSSATVIIPVIVKAHIIVLGVQDLINALRPNKHTKSFTYRLDEFRAGSISFKDLIFCSDLIKDYKDVKKKDKNSIVDLINARNLNANATAVLSGGKGFEANYNMIICTTDDKVKLDKAMNGDIYKEAVKQNFLADLHAIGCTVLDNDYERMTLLIKDIRSKSDTGYKALKKRSKNDSVEDMVKMTQSLLMNKQLTF